MSEAWGDPSPATIEAALDAGRDGVSLDGFRVSEHHDGFTVTSDGLTVGRLSRAAARRRLRNAPIEVANWRYWSTIPTGPPGTRRLLRWAEHAESLPLADRYDRLGTGIERTWGELAIRVERGPDPGSRRYLLRHVDDRERDPAGLDHHDRPEAAREIATMDRRDRYRPLKGAPTLRRGWAFVDLEGPALARAVDFFYPASVANWDRERRGELDVTHFRTTADRQTGIYDIVDEVDGDALDHLVEASCTDSACLRRRAWDETSDREIDVPRGDEPFPCREPCSVFIAAARQIAVLEGDTSREYTLRLTPSEKRQLETLISAVAGGRIHDVREADFADPANRTRARYLRAKRLSDSSGLGEAATAGGPLPSEEKIPSDEDTEDHDA